jgi:hypothetical protein
MSRQLVYEHARKEGERNKARPERAGQVVYGTNRKNGGIKQGSGYMNMHKT